MKRFKLLAGFSIIALLSFTACEEGEYEQYTQSEEELSESEEPSILYDDEGEGEVERNLDEAERPAPEGPAIEDVDTVAVGEEPSEQGFGYTEKYRKNKALEKEYISEDSL